jgi:hypothetical protein
MKKLNRVLTVGFLAIAYPAIAQAAAITEDSLSALSSTSVNLSTSVAFAYYGDTTAPLFTPGIDASPTTDVGNLGAFTAFTTSGLSLPEESSDTLVQVSYALGAGGANPSLEMGATNFDFAGFTSNGINGFSLTSTLFAPTETFSFYLQNYNTTSDFTASLNNGANTPFSSSNQVLFGGSDSTGSGNSTGVLELTVSGAIGDVLTFADASDISGVANNGNGNVGLDAVTVTVPEPSTYAMFGLGALVLVWHLRRGNLTA